MKKNLILTFIFMFGIIYYANAQSTSTTINLVNNSGCDVFLTLESDNGASCIGGSAATSRIKVSAHSTLSYTVSTAPWTSGTPFDFNYLSANLGSGTNAKVADPASCNGFSTSVSPWTPCTSTGSITWTDAPTSPPAPTPTTATVTFN